MITDLLERLLEERPPRSSPLTSSSTPFDSARPQRVAPQRIPEPVSSRYFPDLHTFVDDFWQRENDRELEGFDRTIREAEAHRQRTADFLARAEPGPRRSSLVDRTSHPVSSNYSTLRGALDDSAATRRSLGARAPVASVFTRPLNDGPIRRISLFGEGVESINQDSGLDLGENEPTPYFADSGFSSFRSSAPRMPQHPRPSTDFFSSDLYPSGSSAYDSAPLQPPRESYLEMNSRARSSSISGLRRRARARSHSSPSPPLPPIELSPLWHDTAPHSRPSWRSTSRSTTNLEVMRRRVARESSEYLNRFPPPREPSPDPLDFDASVGRRVARESSEFLAFIDRLSPPRDPSPLEAISLEPPSFRREAESSLFPLDSTSSLRFESFRRPRHRVLRDPSYPIPPLRDPSPNRLDVAPPVPPPLSSSTRARSNRTIDLNAFHEGPFRATLARSMAYTRETRQQPSVSAERERPASTQNVASAFSDSSEEDDDPWDRYLSLRQEPRAAPRDLTGLAPRRQPLVSRNGVSTVGSGTRRLDGIDMLSRTRAYGGSTGSNSITPAATTTQSLPDPFERSSTSDSSERDLDMQRPVDRLRDLVSRPSAALSARSRTLLDRERSFSELVDDTSARTTGLQRWEQRRQVLQRMSARARERGGDSTTSTTASSAQPLSSGAAAHPRASQRDEAYLPSFARREAPPSFLDRPVRPVDPPSRRHARAPQLAPRHAPPGGRTEGATPLAGRFARRGLAPDMVWVDLSATHRLTHFRRRWNLGDYMVCLFPC
ncbi:hypothetical protein K466DRAFT_381686 [Polyporus arcularius HHB13444]|uniref:Uncharacterized protein n=1 Tax=Polyporus arcularius HHB13444 TaxID=1314778 RepID=A0A5C3NVS1_9APHY|nr:hypothetical protein K466DRAFT_381686 [Polyporus arcularius HHB13444]